jgi:hypothetical protein
MWRLLHSMQPSLDFLCGFRTIPPALPASIRGERNSVRRNENGGGLERYGKTSPDSGWRMEDNLVAACERWETGHSGWGQLVGGTRRQAFSTQLIQATLPKCYPKVLAATNLIFSASSTAIEMPTLTAKRSPTRTTLTKVAEDIG